MSPLASLEESVEFADNPEPRCPCVLLLDTSNSMRHGRIKALNQGLRAFQEDLARDEVAGRRVEVAIVTFDSKVKVVQPFITADDFQPPTLVAQGYTHMASGIIAALDLIQRRKEQYRLHGITYYRPWVFLITDGAPEGESAEIVQQATQRVWEEVQEKRLVFFAVGVEEADMERLKQIGCGEPFKLHGLNFVDLFVWLSRSAQAGARPEAGQQFPLPTPASVTRA